jgi:hypothetical protein
MLAVFIWAWHFIQDSKSSLWKTIMAPYQTLKPDWWMFWAVSPNSQSYSWVDSESLELARVRLDSAQLDSLATLHCQFLQSLLTGFSQFILNWPCVRVFWVPLPYQSNVECQCHDDIEQTPSEWLSLWCPSGDIWTLLQGWAQGPGEAEDGWSCQLSGCGHLCIDFASCYA